MENFYLFGKGELAIYCAELYLSKYNKENLKIIPVIPEPTWTESLVAWSEKNRVEISFNDNLDKNFVKDLSLKFFEWTGERWIITFSKKKEISL